MVKGPRVSRSGNRLKVKKSRECHLCGHSLKDNLHGFDQNDYYFDGVDYVHSGSCTYCKACNPALRAALEGLK